MLCNIEGSLNEGEFKKKQQGDSVGAVRGQIQKALTRPTVDSTIALHASNKWSLLPILAKSHYTLNLRDITKMAKDDIFGANPIIWGDSFKTARARRR